MRRVAPDASWKELQLTRALVEPLECEVRALRQAVEQLEPARSPRFGEETLFRAARAYESLMPAASLWPPERAA